MPLNVQCKRCANYRHEWCKEVMDSPDPELTRDCRHFWTRTNAERIRQMSDEKLARWVHDQIIDRNIGVTVESWLDWLKSPVEGTE